MLTSSPPRPQQQQQQQQQLPADTAVFSHPGTPAPQPFHNGRHSAAGLCYQQPLPTPGQNSHVNENHMLPRPLKFPQALDRLDQRDVNFELPDLPRTYRRGLMSTLQTLYARYIALTVFLQSIVSAIVRRIDFATASNLSMAY